MKNAFIIRGLVNKKIGAKVFGELRNVMRSRMEKIKCSEEIINEVLERISEKRTLLKRIPHRKDNCVGHIVRRNVIPRAPIEEQTMEYIFRSSGNHV